MKVKNLKGLILGIVIGSSLMFSFQSFADEGLTKVLDAYFRSDLKVSLNGKQVDLQNVPIVANGGRSYFPLRELASALGLQVYWNADTNTAELNSVTGDVYGSVTGSVYGSVSPTLTPSPDPQVTSTPSPSPDNTPSIQNTPIPTQNQNNMEEISNYFADKNQHALKVNGVIFVTIRGGADKYKIYDATWNADTLTLSFTKENVTIKISNIIGDGDGFIYQGSTYVKESIFSNMVK